MLNKWDGNPRRKSDFEDGKIVTAVILARIDERVNTLIENALMVKTELANHKEDDDKQFKLINRTIFMASGALAVIVFFIDKFLK